MPWGALLPPWPPPPWEIESPRAGAPPGGLYIKGGGEGQPHPEVLAPPPPATPLPPPSRAWRSPAGVLLFHHHHAVVLLLEPSSSTSHSPLAGSRRRRRHPLRTCVERGGAVRSALGSPVIGSRRERLLQPRSFERFRSRSTKWYVDASLLSLVA